MSLNRINARLNGNRVAREDERGRPFPSQGTSSGAIPGEVQAEELSNASFAALTIGLCAVAAGAVFAWHGDYLSPLLTPEPVFVSRVEQCGQGWAENLPNGKQIECYLTQNIERLCNPRERQHLAGVFDRYAGEVIAFRSATAVASLAALPGFMQMSADVGAANAAWGRQLRNPDATEADVNASVDAVAAAAAKTVKRLEDSAASKMLIEGSKREMDRSRMEDAIKRLIALGYMTQDDFGWRAKSTFKLQFEKALAGIGKVKQSCRPMA